jgi:transcriptional regulator with XRE-family HTH domain
MNTVNAKLLSKWIDEEPNRLLKLCMHAGISFSTVCKMKRGAYAHLPGARTRQLMCEIIGAKEALLFPGVKEQKNRAG